MQLHNGSGQVTQQGEDQVPLSPGAHRFLDQPGGRFIGKVIPVHHFHSDLRAACLTPYPTLAATAVTDSSRPNAMALTGNKKSEKEMSTTPQIGRKRFYETRAFLVVIALAIAIVVVVALLLPGQHVVARELPNGTWVNSHGQPVKAPSGF